ncbi:MAG: vanadium-dependent haloperoxidase [Acidimicrobiales bacterium]
MSPSTRRRAGAALLVAALVAAGCGGASDAPAEVSAEPDAGSWRTWVLSSPDQVEVPPPPEPGSGEAEAEVAELETLAAERTAETEELVARWGQRPLMDPWMRTNLELVAARAKDPPLASRGYALVTVAVYDAVVTTWRWKYAYDRQPPAEGGALSDPGPDPSYPSEHAAIAGAASRVLAYLFPERPALGLDEMAEEAAESRLWAGANYRSDVEAGLALGRQVADAVIAKAETAGAGRQWDGARPPLQPRFWAPPPGSVSPPVQPLAGTWDPWVMSAGDQFRAPPPPAFGSPEYRAEAREVMAAKESLTPDQERIARFWEGGQGTSLPPGTWNEVALAYVADAGLSTPRAARVLALLNVAQDDAGVAAWDTKYAYWTPRPENAIGDLGLDPDWTPLLETPLFPSYVSGHAVYSGAAAEVLAYLFPDDAGLFRDQAEESAVSRLYGGIHFRSDNTVGLEMGDRIGRLVVRWAEGDGSGPT